MFIFDDNIDSNCTQPNIDLSDNEKYMTSNPFIYSMITDTIQ